jgi:hypothetical protein
VAGSVISYNGATYLVGGDRTMTAYSSGYPGATQPSTGQDNLIPTQYQSTQAGSVAAYGGVDPLIGGDGTMTRYTGPAGTTQARAASNAPIPGQRYQVPAQDANRAAGSIIDFYGYKYIINNDATMTAISDQGQGTQDEQTSAAPTPGQRYQIPAELANSAPGFVITYGPYKYLANNDGTMTAFSNRGIQP